MMGVSPPGAGKPPFKPSPRMIRLLPRMMRFLIDKWLFAAKAERDFPVLEAESKKFGLLISPQTNEKDLIKAIDQIDNVNNRVTYNTVLSILMMQVYNRMLNGQLSKIGVDYHNFDLTEGMQEIKNYDPDVSLRILHQLYNQLGKGEQQIIKDGDYQGFIQLEGIDEFQEKVQEFLENFGHMSDRTGVFDTIPWRETPSLILQLIAEYQRVEDNPKEMVRFSDL